MMKPLWEAGCAQNAVRGACESLQPIVRRSGDEWSPLLEIFNHSLAILMVLQGPDFVVELANPAAVHFVGSRTILGRPLLDALPELATQRLPEHLRRVFETGEPCIWRSLPVSLRREPLGPLDGCYVDLLFQQIRDAAGKATGVFLQGNDVTERKLLEDELVGVRRERAAASA